MSKDKIWLSSPHMGGDELEFVKEAFASNWIAPVGPHIKAFEQALALSTGVPYCAALSSGTAAIHLALIILGVQEGDEVICSSFTFSASCNPIIYLKARPVFIDSEPDTWNMDPILLEEAILYRRSKTGNFPKAIILVHLYGMPAKLEELTGVAKKYNIPIIEDAAEALGSTYKGRSVGSFGSLGVYSFNGNKIITTSGGGALVSDNQQYIERAHFLSTQAREKEPHYEHKEIGYNYRLSNVCAAIGRGQLNVLKDRVAQRRAVFNKYQALLGDHLSIEFLNEPAPDYFSNRWLTTVLFNNKDQREQVRMKLDQENIESRPLWKPMHLQPAFKDAIQFTNGTSEQLFERGLCLPSGSNLSASGIDRIATLVRSIIQ
jgi:dTDP-4-amino-4,6-dideoxygalactose transaminase